MKKLLEDKKIIYIAAIVILAVVICVSLAMCGNKKETSQTPTPEPEEESTGLQVEENADDGEGDQIDFGQLEDQYYVDDNGNIIDSSTGKPTTNQNLQVDKDGNIVDSTTGEVVQPSKPSSGSGNSSSEGFGTLF